MDTYGAYNGGGIYSVFIGTMDTDGAGQFSTADVYPRTHLGFDMDLGTETLNNNRFVSILVIA